jgi:hypothetical protein
MKVNLGVEINDAQRNVLSNRIAGKPTKRLATRDEVRAYVDGCIASLVEGACITEVPESTAPVATTTPRPTTSDLMRIDPEDEEYLRDKDPGFVVGWNRWKRRRDK